MTHTQLPILGPGSQPVESDGKELDYMHMPGEMATYSAPEIPEAEEVRHLQQAMAVLEELLSQLRAHSGKLNPPIDLKRLDQDNLHLINQVLGEGDVSIVLTGIPKILIQESVLAGVWRVQSVDDVGVVLSDHIEVAKIPWMVHEQSFIKANKRVQNRANSIPDGVMNAPPLLSEINDHIQDDAHVINLSLLPQTPEDLAYLQQQLGGGRVTILSRGYGNCRITSTNTQNVWWVQYFNSQDSMILNTLEMTTVPEVACAGTEDIADSAQRLNEILEVYR